MTQPGSYPNFFSLEPAIDRRPLTVGPETSVAEAIAIMAKAQSSCAAPSLRLPYNVALKGQARASTLYLVEDSRLVGLFGEPQALNAIASGQDLTKASVAAAAVAPARTLDPAQLPDTFTTLDLLRQHHLQPLPVVNGQGHLSGAVTLETLRAALQIDPLLKKLPLSAALLSNVVYASPEVSALDLARQMALGGHSCAVLSAPEAADVAGLVLAQDILQLLRLELNLETLSARDIMRTHLPSFAPTESALVAYWEMQQHQAQQGFVVDESNHLMGLATLTSCLATLDITEMRAAEALVQQSIEAFAEESVRSPAAIAAPPLAGSLADPPVTVETLQEQLESSRLLA
ncbi:MAG TPA: CBS domain-containing protein, partial [Trichocoleus sp.]